MTATNDMLFFLAQLSKKNKTNTPDEEERKRQPTTELERERVKEKERKEKLHHPSNETRQNEYLNK